MAIAIKQIPVLTDKVASSFNKRADVAYSNKHTVDFSAQIKMAKAILEKAKI